MLAIYARIFVLLALHAALTACASDRSVEVVGDDAVAMRAARRAPPPQVQRYPWGPLFNPRAAARDCNSRRDSPWWCGGLAAVDVGMEDACPGDTWLAFRLDALPCPAAMGWDVEAPYDGSGHPDLERVCRYTNALTSAPPLIATLPDNPSIRVEPDCQVVAAHAVPDDVWQPLEAAWKTQMSLPDYSMEPEPMVGSTRVAVLDTSPSGGFNGAPVPGQTSPHGLIIGNVIRTAACPAGRGEDGPCAAHLHNHIALPRAYGGARPPRGGAFGTQGEFTEAVVDALEQWHAAASGERLVINLSIGWTAMHGGDPADESRFVPLTGLWALDLASCHGALSIAASGNRSTPGEVGATYPAAWTTEPSLCDPAVPAVYAVGGVDGRDAPLAVSRPGSQPRLVAPAAQVIVQDERFNAPFGVVPVSGTSLAAAGTSATAALVWAWRPDLDAAGVMEVIYNAGAPLPGFAEVDMQGAVPQRRLDVCASITRACAGGLCLVEPPACPGRPVDARPDDEAVLQLMHAGADELMGAPQPVLHAQDVMDAPYAVPQPTVTQCPYCGIATGQLYGTLVSTPGAILVSGVLQIDDGLAGVEIPLPDLPIDKAFKLPLGYNGEIKGAWLEGQLEVDGKIVDTASEIVVVD